MEDGKLIFHTEDGEEIAFYILEQTTISGVNYLLVTESDEDEADALILKERAEDNGEETVYDVIEDEEELSDLAKIFEELLEDVDIDL